MVNLLFITMHPDKLTTTEPFVVAYDLDQPDPGNRRWRVDRVRGVEYHCGPVVSVDGKPLGMHGVWRYLMEETWIKLTQQEAFAKFPELQAALENWVEPW